MPCTFPIRLPNSAVLSAICTVGHALCSQTLSPRPTAGPQQAMSFRYLALEALPSERGKLATPGGGAMASHIEVALACPKCPLCTPGSLVGARLLLQD